MGERVTKMFRVTIPDGDHPFSSITIDNHGGLHIEYKTPRALSMISVDEMGGNQRDIWPPTVPSVLIEKWLHIQMRRMQ